MSSEYLCYLCDYQASTEIDVEAHIFKSHSDIFIFEQHPDLPNVDASKLVPKTEQKETAIIVITEEIETTSNNLTKTEVLMKGVAKETVNYFF